MAAGADGGSGPPGRGGRRARRLVAWLSLALLAALLVPLALGRCDGGPAAAPTVSAPPPPRPSEPVALEQADAPPEAELPEPIQRYLGATRYPPTSGRLTADHVDLLLPNRRHERMRPLADTVGGDPADVVSAVLTADRYFYTDEDVAHLRLAAERGAAPLDVRVLEASAVREGRAGPEGAEEAILFRHRDGGLSADLPLARFAGHHGPVFVRVRFEYAPGRTREEDLRLFVTPTDLVPARFTGELRDSVRDGNLLLEVGIEIERAGFFRFDANLYDAAGQPLAFAIFKGALSTHDAWVPLEVFGKVLRDAGRPGPYVVGELRGYRFRDGEYPDRERMPDYDRRFATGPYPLEAFSDAVYASAHKQHMVELMQQDLANGLTLDVPPLPGAGAAPPPAPDAGAHPAR